MANYSEKQLKGIFKVLIFNLFNIIIIIIIIIIVLKEEFEKYDADKSGAIDKQGLFQKHKLNTKLNLN
jgi:hypothetical protein